MTSALDSATRAARRATLLDVARRAGVSTATVSNAHRHPERLAPELLERVLRTAAALGYHPDPVARGLRLGASGAVGVLYRDELPHAFADPAFSRFLEGVAGGLAEDGRDLLLLSGSSRPGREPLLEAAMDAVIWYGPSDRDPRRELLARRGLPAVLVDAERRSGGAVLRIDDREGGRVAGDHVFGLGHRAACLIAMGDARDGEPRPVPLATLRSSGYRAVRDRTDGLLHAATANGVAAERITALVASNDVVSGALAGRAVLGSTSRPTAIVCLSDPLALGVLLAARELGIDVPRQLTVVGFDDVPESARSSPPLTTVRQDHHGKGLAAARAVTRLLAGEPVPRLPVLAVDLVVRGSSGPPPDPQGRKRRHP